MVKAARVTLVGLEKIGSGRVMVREDVKEVQARVFTGTEAVNRVDGGQVLSTHIKSSSSRKLRIRATHSLHEEVEQFRSY